MRKIILQISILFVLFLNYACVEDEKGIVSELNNNEVIDIDKLPGGYLTIDQLISKYNKEESKNVIQSKEGSTIFIEGGGTNNTSFEQILLANGYRKIFIIYPKKFRIIDRVLFFIHLRTKVSPNIVSIEDSCSNVDTFYFPKNSIVPDKDRRKNLVVASTNKERVEEEDDDGPKLPPETVYNTCYEVTFSEEYIENN